SGHKALGDGGFPLRTDPGLLEECAEGRDGRVGRIGSVEQAQREAALALVQLTDRSILGELDRVDEVLLLTAGATTLERAGDHVEDDEEDVDDRGRRLEEVVVVGW